MKKEKYRAGSAHATLSGRPCFSHSAAASFLSHTQSQKRFQRIYFEQYKLRQQVEVYLQ